MENKTRKVDIRMTEEQYKTIKELAEYLDMPISTMTGNLVYAAADDAKFLKKIGVLKGAKKIVDFQEKWQILVRNLNENDKTATNA